MDEAREKLFPQKAGYAESVARGFDGFQKNCIACHSLNLEGGVLGPELNIPKNILEYRERKMLKEFISNPSSFRARSKMPAFENSLSSQSFDDLLDYLDWIGKHKYKQD
jgi:mono/diheme cytochrome c family protein